MLNDRYRDNTPIMIIVAIIMIIICGLSYYGGMNGWYSTDPCPGGHLTTGYINGHYFSACTR